MLNVKNIDDRLFYDDKDVKVRVDAGEIILNGEQIIKLMKILKR